MQYLIYYRRVIGQLRRMPFPAAPYGNKCPEDVSETMTGFAVYCPAFHFDQRPPFVASSLGVLQCIGQAGFEFVSVPRDIHRAAIKEMNNVLVLEVKSP